MENENIRKPNIIVEENSSRAGEKMLEIFIEEADRSIRERGNFYFATSGGHTPMKFYKLLGSRENAKRLNWGRIHLFWVDERIVSKDSPESNYKSAADAFLNKVGLPQQNIHRIPTELDDYQACALNYENQLRDAFGIGERQIPQFDLILLGMGNDGHTASLFPGSANLKNNSPRRLTAVEHRKGLDRITLTPLPLTEARKIIVLVTGKEKAEMLSRVFSINPDRFKFPIHLLWKKPEKVTFLTDKSAAAGLWKD